MGRKKLYDPNEVMDRAIELFAVKGVSVPLSEIGAPLGVSKQNLLAAYGTKESLMKEALETAIHKLEIADKRLNKQPLGIENIKKYLDDIRIRKDLSGALINRLSLESSSIGDELAVLCVKRIRKTDRMFYQNLKAAQDNGDIAKDRDIDGLSKYLVTTLQGIYMMLQINKSPQGFKATVDNTILTLQK